MSWSEKCSKITAIVLDVDGVLTDGRIGYRDNGDEVKFFDVKDGHGIVLARRAGTGPHRRFAAEIAGRPGCGPGSG